MCLSLEFDCHDQNNLVISPDRERECVRSEQSFGWRVGGQRERAILLY